MCSFLIIHMYKKQYQSYSEIMMIKWYDAHKVPVMLVQTGLILNTD